MSSVASTNIVKLSAAGAGKTWDICHDALDAVNECPKKRVLITTYTHRGAEAARTEICHQNCGVSHPRVIVKTWFSFLMTDMIKPYQTYITGANSFNVLKGFDFSETFGKINFQRKGTRARYLTPAANVRSNVASELTILLNEKSDGKVIRRLEEVYDAIYIDEVQDLAGYDIDIIRLLVESKVTITCCGDNKQATFKTHNTKKNKQKTGKNIVDFFVEVERAGLIRIQKNLVSRRFNSQICAFANLAFPTGDPIATTMNIITDHDGVFLIDYSDADVYYCHFHPQALRHDIKTKVCYPVVNFGACKGETYARVMIFPNGPLKDFILKGKSLESPEKYYVGLTRSKYSIAFVIEKMPMEVKGYEEVVVECGETKIHALHYQVE